MRIFPDLFDIVPLGAEGPNADPANVIGITHAGLIADGGPWGRACLDFLFSRRAADRQLVCDALLVTNRALRKWINCFNASGVDGLIVKKRPGRMAIINGQQACELAQLIDHPQQAERTLAVVRPAGGRSLVCR